MLLGAALGVVSSASSSGSTLTSGMDGLSALEALLLSSVVEFGQSHCGKLLSILGGCLYARKESVIARTTKLQRAMAGVGR